MLTSSQIFKLIAPISSNGASQVALMVKNLPSSAGHQFNAWVGKVPWGRAQPPTPVFLPGESHGQRNLVGYSPWGHRRVRHNLATNNNNPDIHCSTIYKTKTWKQCKYPLTEEWINKFWYTYTMKKKREK